jgi:hypothetical protein
MRDLESEDDWKKHVEGVWASVEPDGYLEEEMANRLAGLLWRLRRVGAYEAEQITLDINDIPENILSSARYIEAVSGKTIEDRYTVEKMDTLIGARQFPRADIIERIMKYESHLHRQYIQTLHELEALQARRRGERTPLARLDITGSPA